MRDRLMELIDRSKSFESRGLELLENQADYLLENGVIVLPCKPGAEIYFAGIESGEILKGKLIKFSFEEDHIWFNCQYSHWLAYWHPIEDFGVRVFVTREEAEQAMKEQSNGGQ